MSEVAGELARVKDAFAQPTLTLLHQRQAPVVISVFRAAFGRSNTPIPTARAVACAGLPPVVVSNRAGRSQRSGPGED